MYRPALTTGALFAALAVMLGAFGAHSLKAYLGPAGLQTFETGVRYQFYHSFALLVTGLAYTQFPVRALRFANIFFAIGILLFSGSLYVLALLQAGGAGLGPIGILTPVGGLFFIAGWFSLFAAVSRRAPRG